MAGNAKYRTLKQLRHDLQARLGFGAAGAAANVNAPLLDSMLRQAHSDLYEIADWVELRGYSDALSATVANNGTHLSYPTDCNINRIRRISADIGTSTNNWVPLKEGLDDRHYSVMTQTSWPRRYERFSDGLEIYPYRDATYPLRVFYIKDLTALDNDSDHTSIRDGIVFLYALANAKAHYRHPDATVYARQLEAVLEKVRRGTFGNKRYQSGNALSEGQARPSVVDDGSSGGTIWDGGATTWDGGSTIWD